MTDTHRGVVRYPLGEEASPVRRLDPQRELIDAKSLADEVPEQAESLREAVRQQDWTRLGAAGREMRSRGDRELHRLLRVQEKLNRASTGTATDAAARGEPPDPGDINRADVLQRLEAGGPLGNLVDDPERFVRALAAGDVDSPEEFSGEVPDATATLLPRLHRKLRTVATWYVVVGYDAELKAELFAAQEAVEPDRLSMAALEAIEDDLAELRSSGRRLLGRVQGALIGEEWDRLEECCRRGRSLPVEVVDDLVATGRTLRAGRTFYEQSSERGSENDAVEVARVQVALHRTVKTLETLLAACCEHLVLARQRGRYEESEDAVKRARETHFESLVRDGVNVDLDDLLESPGEYDGRLVETEGFVERLRHVTQDGYGTKFDLVDRYHDVRVVVFYPYRDLTERFFTDGAYAHLNGEFTASSEHEDGDPSIQIDVVNLGENGEESWLDAVVDDLEDDVSFERFPAQGNVLWSLEPPRPEPDGGDAE